MYTSATTCDRGLLVGYIFYHPTAFRENNSDFAKKNFCTLNYLYLQINKIIICNMYNVTLCVSIYVCINGMFM